MTNPPLPRFFTATLASLLLSLTAAAKVTENFSETYPLDANGVIRLDNVNGSVEIVAWDRPEVSLSAEKSANNSDGLARIHLIIESSPDRLTIRTELENKWKFWNNMNAQVHYKLKVPAGVALEKIDVVNSNVHVSGVTGPVKLETVNGSIKADGLTGRGKFNSVNGPVHITYVSLAGQPDISLDTVNGSCTLNLPADAAFQLDSETVNGRLSCDFPITLEKSGRHNLSGSVNGGGSRVKMESVNGGLSVKMAK